jgi:hypothetical protein
MSLMMAGSICEPGLRCAVSSSGIGTAQADPLKNPHAESCAPAACQKRGAAGESPCDLNYGNDSSFPGCIRESEFPGEAFGDYPSSAVATPHLFEKVAVTGVCVA